MSPSRSSPSSHKIYVFVEKANASWCLSRPLEWQNIGVTQHPPHITTRNFPTGERGLSKSQRRVRSKTDWLISIIKYYEKQKKRQNIFRRRRQKRNSPDWSIIPNDHHTTWKINLLRIPLDVLGSEGNLSFAKVTMVRYHKQKEDTRA